MKVLTNGHTRPIVVGHDLPPRLFADGGEFADVDPDHQFVKVYGLWWDLDGDLSGLPADELRAQGYDWYIPIATTNVGSSGLALRFFDRDGVEYQDECVTAYVIQWVSQRETDDEALDTPAMAAARIQERSQG